MADIAELGLKINSQPVDQAGAKLKNFGKIASDTERKVLQSTNGMATGFKSFNKNMATTEPAIKRVETNLKNFGTIASATERKVLQSTNGMATGFKSFNKNMATTEPAIKRVETNLKNFKLVSERSLFPKGGAALTAIKDFRAELERVPSGTGQAVTAISSIEKTAKTATATSGNFSNSIRQISLQLSQVAQQGAVTGDFFRAFTIQLPDLLLGFGTLGVLIGAVAGALGGPLIDALTGSSKAIKNVDEDIADLTDGFEDLTDAQRAYVLLSSEIKQADLQKEFDDIGQQVRVAADELKILEQGFRRTARGQRISIPADAEDIQEAELALKRLSAVRDNIGLKLEREIKLQGELRDATDLTTQSALEANRAQSKTDLLSELEATTEAIERAGSTQTEIAVRAAAERNSILAAAYNEDLISFGEYQEQRVQNQLNLQAELTEIDEKAQQQRTQILTAGQEAALSASGQLFGNLASIAKEGGEDQFQEYKNLASAQAAIAASLAAIKALAEGGPILGPALAVSIGAVAAIQIAKIQGQEYQSSRASGGQAKGRVLVGENGPEILNMGNSTGSITSAADTKKEMQGQTVQQIFNISPGLSGAIQAEIERAIPLMAKVAVSSVSGDIRRGGSTAKAVGIR